MNKETAFSLGLPKWPQLRLTGPNVGEALAKEIIFATDVFLTSFGSSGGVRSVSQDDKMNNPVRMIDRR